MERGIREWAFSASGLLLLIFTATSSAGDTLLNPLRILGSTPSGSAAIVPDGSTIATCCNDRCIKVWDADSGICRAVMQGHTEAVASIAFSPNGTTLLSGSWDKTAKLWNRSNGACLLTLTRHSLGVTAVAFSPDEKKCMTGSMDQTARIWDVTTGICLRTIYVDPQPRGSGVHSVAFSPDGTKVLTGSTNVSQLWDAATGDLVRTFTGQLGEIYSVCFSPDGTKILTSSQDDGNGMLWDVSTGVTLKKFSGDHAYSYNVQYYVPVVFSPGGQSVIVGTKIYNLSNDSIRTLSGHKNAVVSVAFSADGSKILTGSLDSTARLWSAATGDCLRTITTDRHTRYVTSVAFSTDGTRAITGSWDSSACCWDLSTGRRLWKFSKRSWGVNAVALSPEGSLLALGTNDRKVFLLNSTDGSTVQVCSKFNAPILDVAFSTDGSKILAAADGKALTWNPATQDTTELSVLPGLNPPKFSPDGSKILVTSSISDFKCVNSATGDSLQGFAGDSAMVLSLSYSPDGKKCLSGSLDNSIKLWDVATGSCIKTFTGHNGGILALAFSSDGAKIISGSLDSTGRLWDVASGNCERLFRVTSPLLSVAISRDGSRIVTASADNTVRVWPTTYMVGTKPRSLLQAHRNIRFLTASARSLIFEIPEEIILTSGASVCLYALDGSRIFALPASRSAAGGERATIALPIRLAVGTYLYGLSGVRSRGIKDVTGIFTVCR